MRCQKDHRRIHILQEIYVFHESHISGCEPEVGIMFEDGAVDVEAGHTFMIQSLFYIVVRHVDVEGARLLEVHRAVAKADCPDLRITLGIGVLVVIAEYAEITDRDEEVGAVGIGRFRTVIEFSGLVIVEAQFSEAEVGFGLCMKASALPNASSFCTPSVAV